MKKFPASPLTSLFYPQQLCLCSVLQRSCAPLCVQAAICMVQQNVQQLGRGYRAVLCV